MKGWFHNGHHGSKRHQMIPLKRYHVFRCFIVVSLLAGIWNTLAWIHNGVDSSSQNNNGMNLPPPILITRRDHYREPSRLGQPQQPRPRIAIQSISIGLGDDLRIAQENHKSYCQKWGYDYIAIEQPLDKRSPPWQKIPATLQTLEQASPPYDYVMWIDADALFVECQQSLDPLLEKMQSEKSTWLFSGDTVVINSGQMIWKNTPRSLEILRGVDALWYEEFDVHHKVWDNGAFVAYVAGARAPPNTQEINAAYDRGDQCWLGNQTFCSWLHYGNPKILEAVVANHDNRQEEALWREVSYVPTRAINSYGEKYQPGDYIFHCAGQGDKAACLNNFMAQSGHSSLICNGNEQTNDR